MDPYLAKAIAAGIWSATDYLGPIGAATGGMGAAYGLGRLYANRGRTALRSRVNPFRPGVTTRAIRKSGAGGPPGGGGFVPGSSGGKVFKKRKRVMKSRKRKFRKSRFRKIRKGKKTMLGKWFRNDAGQLTSAVNKVNWINLDVASNSTWTSFLQHEVAITASDGVTTSVTMDPSDLSGLGQTKNYLLIRKFRYVFKNNSNAPAELVFYKYQVKDQSATDFAADLDNRITANLATLTTSVASTPAAPLAKEDNFQQYWMTPNMKQSKYMVKRSQKVLLAGGDEYVFSGSFVIPIQSRNAVTSDYMKGQQGLVVRIMGRPSHDTTTSSNVGVSDTCVDFLESSQTTAYSSSNPILVNNFRTLANSNFSAITPVVAGDATVADVTDG